MRITFTTQKEEPSNLRSLLDIALFAVGVWALTYALPAGLYHQYDRGTYFLLLAFLFFWMAKN